LGAVLGVSSLLFVACGSGGEGDGFDKGKNGRDGSDSPTGPNGTGPGGGGFGDPVDAASPGNACVAERQVAEKAPVDLFLMVDTSGSMTEATSRGPTKWAALKGALSAFADDPRSAGLGLGYRFFPEYPTGIPRFCSPGPAHPEYGACLSQMYCEFSAPIPEAQVGSMQDCNRGGALCGDPAKCKSLGRCSGNPSMFCTRTPGTTTACAGGLGTCEPNAGRYSNFRILCGDDAYATPSGATADLPGAAAGFKAALDAREMQGNTPLMPALRGAIAYAQKRSRETVGRRNAVVLVTDGFPTDCDPALGTRPGDPYNITGLAEEAQRAAAQGTPVFVVGVFAPAEEAQARRALDAIAAAGGTSRATIVRTDEDVASKLTDAFATIRGEALACDYVIPAPPGNAKLDYDRVNVVYSPAGAPNGTTIPRADDAASCPPSGAWHYDVKPGEGTPTRLVLCPASCAAVRAGGGAIDFAYGCASERVR
jgi:hypothetical protein